MKQVLPVWLAGAALAVSFWWPLAAGKSRVGGDIYDYYLPLKLTYAQGLRQGRVPLWTPLVGYGAPMLADSQVGAFYPINLILFRLLPLVTAFEASFLLHFTLGFGFMYHFGRSAGLGVGASLVSAVAFLYGWFPVRACLEWAYVTGIWMPLALMGVQRRLQGRPWTCLWTTVLALLMQLLAGHFQAAWLTLLLVVLYGLFRALLVPRPEGRPVAPYLTTAGACILALGLGAVQVLPTWELRGLGQRRGASWRQTIVSESVPAWYLGQVVWPWHYYWGDQSAAGIGAPIGPRNTNMVEANLYPGWLMLWLAGGGVLAWRRRPEVRPWSLVLLVSVLLVLGAGLDLLVHLPGFSFFRYPGRYNLLSAFALAVLAGVGMEAVRALSARAIAGWTLMLVVPQVALAGASLAVAFSPSWSGALAAWMARHLWRTDAPANLQPWLLVGIGVCLAAAGLVLAAAGLRRSRWVVPLVLLVSLAEYYALSRQVTYVAFVDPPLARLNESEIGRRVGGLDRLIAPGENLFTLLGVSCLPPYMGLGPAPYFDDDLVFRGFLAHQVADARQWERVRLAGVTHVVSIGPRAPAEPLDLIWQEHPDQGGRDRFIYAAWGRFPWDAPLCLYRVRGACGRAYLVDTVSGQPDPALGDTQVAAPDTETVIVDVSANRDCTCVLTDLCYPGWSVEIDGRPAPIKPFRQVFRSVDVPQGRRRLVFRFRPASVQAGLAISGVSAGIVLVLAVVSFSRRRGGHSVRGERRP